jgi:hypothetical protein
LRLTIAKMRRELFGARSDRKARLLDQPELQLEEFEADAREAALAAETTVVAHTETAAIAGLMRRKPSRKPFPAGLPRERVIIPEPTACSSCG